MSITPSPSIPSATQHGSGSLVSEDSPEFAKVRIEDVDDTVPPEFTIPSTLESMHDGFNGEGLPQGRPTTRVSDVLTPACRSNAMDFLSHPNIQGQANLSTPSLAVPRPQSLIQESMGKETNFASFSSKTKFGAITDFSFS
jgi:hypothetical protein